MFKRLMVSILVLVLLVVSVAPINASAAQPGEQDLRYNYIQEIGGGIRITGNSLKCSGIASSAVTYTTTKLKVTLQKKATGSNYWSYVTSWTDNSSGIIPASVDETYTYNSSYSYRLYITCTIKDGDTIVEQASMYSNEVP